MKVAKPLSNKEDMVFFNYVGIDDLIQGSKIRDIDDATVDTLVESFKQFGVLEPITVVTVANSGKYKVIVGHHRYLAFKQLLATVPDADRSDFTLPAVCLHINEGDDTEALQIAENLHRNDLSKEERKVMACRYLELLNEQKPNREQKPKKEQKPQGGRPEAWFSQWYEAVGIPRPTAQRMWQQYADATGLTITPSKADNAQQKAFAAWHLEQAAKAEQAKAEQSEAEQQAVKDKALADATDAYHRAKGLYQRACDVASKAGVENIVWIS